MAEVINIDSARPEREPSIEALQKLVGEDMQKVNQSILTNMESRVPLVPQLAGHLIASGGKRIRPMLTLACARLCGYTGSRHIDLAAAVEFIHTASLLHDDVVDDSDLRRGEKPANILWGNEAAVLVGDFLFCRSFQMMVRDGSLEVLRVLSGASAQITEGEVMQLENTRDITISEEAYMEVVRGKTSTLFAAACHVGGIVAERPEKEIDALISYGTNLGIVFQLVDDYLDYSADEAKLGKTIGDDFREGKITLPVLLAVRRGDDEELSFWQRCMGQLKQEEGDLEQAVALMTKHNALADTIERARHYGALAKDALAIFPEGPVRDALGEAVDFCIYRAH